MKTILVWFKTDLRLHDNETFRQAADRGDQVIPVYCLDDAQFAETPFGFRKTGAFRARFLLESLRDLDTQLRAMGSGLLLLRGKPHTELPRAASRFGASLLFAKKEVAHEELEEHEAVEKALWKVNCVTEVFSTSTLYHALDLPFAVKAIPDVFTKFRHKVEHEGVPVRDVVEKPLSVRSPAIPLMCLPTLGDLGFEPVADDPRSAFPFKGGETEAFKRLNDYLFGRGLVSTYKETRNQMLGSDYSSKFSPWMAMGCLSPREVYHELKRYEEAVGANDSTYWLHFELMWRDYFRFMMKKHHSAYFMKYGIRASADTAPTEHNAALLQDWIDGCTGNDFVDAAMRELKYSGYMSNRARQNVASFLCHQLQVDWRYGAAYFEQQLIDYDVCSNWGNWAYLAGVGNDPRGKRSFNLDKQAQEYDPDGSYRRLWLDNALSA